MFPGVDPLVFLGACVYSTFRCSYCYLLQERVLVGVCCVRADAFTIVIALLVVEVLYCLDWVLR